MIGGNMSLALKWPTAMAMGADVNVILTLNLIVDVNISFLSIKDLKALLWSPWDLVIVHLGSLEFVW